MLSSTRRALTGLTLRGTPGTTAAAALSSVLPQSQPLSGRISACVEPRCCDNVGSVRAMSKKSKRGGDDSMSNQQHEEWVKFQQSISVSGFETGQTKTLTQSGLTGRKDRGGKQLRRRREKEAAMERALAGDGERDESGPGGQFPALRYSDEETERLLQEAYGNMPERAGKRGTRNLKRMEQRMERKRQYHAKKKGERIREHERRMEKRSRIVREVLAVKEEAPEVVETEREYQERVMRAWAEQAALAEGVDGTVRQVVRSYD